MKKYRLYDYYTGELFGRTYRSFSKACKVKEKLNLDLVGIWEI